MNRRDLNSRDTCRGIFCSLLFSQATTRRHRNRAGVSPTATGRPRLRLRLYYQPTPPQRRRALAGAQRRDANRLVIGEPA